MESLLAKFSSENIKREPFPHLIARDVLGEELVDQLISQFPPTEVIRRSRKSDSNVRFGLPSGLALESPAVSPLWKEFVARHTSQTFWQECVKVFRSAISETFPDLEKKIGILDRLKAGVQHLDSFSTVDVLLNATIAVNTPVTSGPSSVRGTHVDDPRKLLVGLFYLRLPQDTSRGGDLNLYALKSAKLRFKGHNFKRKNVDLVATVPYERNRMLFFVNCLRSLHGVSLREVTPYPRIFVQFTADFKEPIFDLRPYQKASFGRLWSRWFRNSSRSVEPSPY